MLAQPFEHVADDPDDTEEPMVFDIIAPLEYAVSAIAWLLFRGHLPPA